MITPLLAFGDTGNWPVAAHCMGQPPSESGPAWVASKAKRLGNEDDADSAGGLVANEQNLGEQAARVALALHAKVFTRQVVLAHATKTFVHVADLW